MNMTVNRRRSLWVGGGITIVLLLTLLFPGLTPWSPADATSTGSGGTPPGVCVVHHYALDSGKESTNAFGPPVIARDEATIKAELRERRLCGNDLMGDPTLTAAHYAAWSATGLTAQKVDFSGIDAFAAKLAADQPMWTAIVDEMTALENASTFSLEAIPAGSPSLYMVPDGAGGVTTHQGFTVGNGVAVVFKHGNYVIKDRLECGFQDVRETFPGVSQVPPGSPELPKPTPTPTPTPTPKVCPPNMPYGTWPVCKDKPSVDPAAQGKAPVGNGTNKDPGSGAYVPPADMVQPPATPYVAPAPPAVTTPPVTSSPDPAPAPSPQVSLPAAPPVCAPAPGLTTCS